MTKELVFLHNSITYGEFDIGSVLRNSVEMSSMVNANIAI